MRTKTKGAAQFAQLLTVAAILAFALCWSLALAGYCNNVPEPPHPTIQTTQECAQLTMGYGCTPMQQPPTDWARVCCYPAAQNCWQVWHRWQCCAGNPDQWKNYYKK